MFPEEQLQRIDEEERAVQQQYDHRLFVCMGAACLSSGSAAVKDALETEIDQRELKKRCQVTGGGCRGLCIAGPTVTVEPEDILYGAVAVDDVPEIVESLTQDTLQPIERLHHPSDSPFFAKQERIVLEASGKINSERIEDYIALGGYSSLLKAVTEMSPSDIINEVTRSGLRGRGGAGYPTGLKWRTVAKARGERKFVVCNGDEGDPGAFMDRSVMDDYPHRLLEGMIIAGYAVGAQKGYLYIRAEYPLSVERVNQAIHQARRHELLGNNIGGTPFSFDVEVRVGAGAFVCGEETALLASIEGNRGQPRPRPPYPATYGLWGYPTLINNVETFANIAAIIRNGGDWFASIGTESSKGTKVFALTGDINRSGLIEVPMGISLREIVYDIGGGIPNGRKFKALQVGGASGGCIPEAYLDLPVDFEALKQIDSIIGSGGIVVMDDSKSMVDVAKFFIEFCMSESCGKCVPCRVGTAHMFRLLNKITAGDGTLADLDMLEELGNTIQLTSLCGLGQAAPNTVMSTLKHFRDDYLAYIQEEPVAAY